MTTQPVNQPVADADKTARTPRSTSSRMRNNAIFQGVCIAATLLAILILLVLLVSILTQGLGSLDAAFFTQNDISSPEVAGVRTSLIGTVMIVVVCALSAIPLGVGTAILIEEFKPKKPVLMRIHGIIDTNIRNLAGVPSIVYGILGASAFAMMFGLFGPMNGDGMSIGQEWFDQYQAEDKQLYYAPRDGSLKKDPGLLPAAAGITLYTSKDLKEQAPELTWVTEDNIEPRRDAILKDLDDFDSALRSGVKETRTGRRGPPDMTRGQAAAIADAAIEAGTWQSDPEVFRKPLANALFALNGLGFKELINGQNAAISLAVDAEYAARMPDTMMIDKAPVRVDRKSWYYIALPFGRGVLAGGLTLMLVILPIVIVASQEALRAVPGSYRQAALAMGATRWQSVSKTALPAAIPGICTGVILAISRAIGEAAPILVLGSAGYVTSAPGNLMDAFSALPMTIYYWSGLPAGKGWEGVAAAGIIVLLVVLLSFNAIAIYIRQRSSRHH